MTKTAAMSSLSFLLLVAAMAHLSSTACGLPVQDVELDKAMAEEAVLQNMAAILSQAAARKSAETMHHPVFFGDDANSVPPYLLQALADDSDVSLPGGRKSFRIREGEPLLKKRTFDSIARNSGFGHSHSPWGSHGRSGSDNLTFTFESLFPAIARGLRSVK